MDFQKKLVLPDHLLSPRKKAVSRYGLWISAPFILLSVVLLSNSLKGRVVAPLFQGFNTVGVNSSLTSWPFPFSTSYFSPPFNNNATSGTISKVHGGGDSAPKSPEAAVVAVVLGKTHLDDFSGKDKNGTLQDTQGSNGGNVSDSSSGKRVLDSSHLVNSSVVVKNASLHGEEGLVIIRNFSFSGSTQGKSMENSMNVNYTTSQNNNGELGGSSPAAAGQEREDQDKISYEKCDLFDGKWIKDDSKPYYPEGSCPHIDWDFDCHLNGRPDGGFVKWKWQPNGCNIPSLNATDFLERLRGKKLVFVGDSLNRNMWESLVCILRHSIKNKKSVYEISGRTEFKKKGFYAFIFEDYNCTVDFVGSPFLVRESTFNGKNGAIETLRLDLMDKTTSMYQDADIIVFNTGHWWTHEKTSKGEDYYQEGNHVYPRLKVLEAYKRALMTWARWVDKNIDGNRTQVFFRGYSVNHFKGGQWNSGGQCHKETEPIFNEAYLAKCPSKMRALEHVLPQMKTPVTYLNISRLTDYRKDGHPSIYRMQYKTAEERIAAERAQDCSHWCLPGVPDTWNELLYASLLNLGWGSWRI